MKQFKNGGCALNSGGCHFNQFAFAPNVIVMDLPIQYDEELLKEIRKKYTTKTSRVNFDIDNSEPILSGDTRHRCKCRMELYLKLDNLDFKEKIEYAWKIVEPLIQRSIIKKPQSTYKKKDSRGKPIIQMSKTGEIIAVFPSLKAAGKTTGVNTGSISQAARRKSGYSSAGGFKWMYEEEYVKKNGIIL